MMNVKRRIHYEHVVSLALLAVIFAAALGVYSKVKFYGDDIRFFNMIQNFHNSPPATTSLFHYLKLHLSIENSRLATAVSTWVVFAGSVWRWRIANAFILTLFCFLGAKTTSLLAEKINRLSVYLPVFYYYFSRHQSPHFVWYLFLDQRLTDLSLACNRGPACAVLPY